MQRNKYSLLLLVLLMCPIPALFLESATPEFSATQVGVLSNAVSPFDRGPTVNMVTNNSAVIFWRTDGLTNATVRYGLNLSLLGSVDNSTLDTDHLISLTGLDIDSKYYYQAISNGIMSPVYHFFTAPPDGEEFKMILIGDNRPGTTVEQPEVFSQLAQMIVAEQPHIVIMTGDYVMEVNENHEENLLMWEYFTNISDSIGHYAPIYSVIGNHDTGARTGTLRLEYYLDAFVQYGEPSLNFSFDYAGVHFAFLSTEEPGYEGRIVGDQFAWLENDLASTDREMKFVVQHRPLVPVAHIDDSWNDIPPADRDALQALYEEQNVTLLITGHDHCFNRLTLNGIVQIIAGGGGAPVYNHPTWGGGFFHYVRTNVSSSFVNITAIKADGSVAHNYQLPYSGPIEIEHRIIPSGSTKPVGTMPVIFFSEVPAEKYFSWDSGENQTELTGIPNENGEHTLDIFAKNADDIWSHASFTFIATGATPTQPGGGPIDPLLILGGVSIAGVVVVIALVWIRRK
ncbi:MAG: metallophosphoesterase family protein [Promethearchaeota archaeon]